MGRDGLVGLDGPRDEPKGRASARQRSGTLCCEWYQPFTLFSLHSQLWGIQTFGLDGPQGGER